MTPQASINIAVKRMIEATHPSKIILFGSQASGTAADDSDLDFLVIEPHVDSKVKEMTRLRRAIGNIGLGVDILVCSEEEAAEWGGVPGSTLYWALQEGRVLYEAAD